MLSAVESSLPYLEILHSTVDGIWYNCCEQYMMAGKARLFDDKESLDDIMEAAHPRTQKQLGRQVRGFKDSVWKKNCLEIVTQGNLAKFRQNLDLRHKLLSTGNRIIAEASPKDRIWGIGLHARDKKSFRIKNFDYRNNISS